MYVVFLKGVFKCLETHFTQKNILRILHSYETTVIMLISPYLRLDELSKSKSGDKREISTQYPSLRPNQWAIYLNLNSPVHHTISAL